MLFRSERVGGEVDGMAFDAVRDDGFAGEIGELKVGPEYGVSWREAWDCGVLNERERRVVGDSGDHERRPRLEASLSFDPIEAIKWTECGRDVWKRLCRTFASMLTWSLPQTPLTIVVAQEVRRDVRAPPYRIRG